MAPAQEARAERAVARVFRPFTTLPSQAHQASIGPLERRAWVEALPDALAGLLRQFRSQALDLGALGFDDSERFRVYRSQVFDLHDRLALQLLDWLRFYRVVDALDEDRVDPDLIDLLAGGL